MTLREFNEMGIADEAILKTAGDQAYGELLCMALAETRFVELTLAQCQK